MLLIIVNLFKNIQTLYFENRQGVSTIPCAMFEWHRVYTQRYSPKPKHHGDGSDFTNVDRSHNL